MGIENLNTLGELDAFIAERVRPGSKALSGLVTWGTGAPSGAPKAARALYLQLDGGANTTLWVWEGAAWAAK